MMVAQQLYEGIELGDEGATGLITYMRTDSVRVAEEAQREARETVTERWGADHLPAKPPFYKTKRQGQDAHEAVRPTAPRRDPESIARHLSPDQRKLYSLIWRRFIGSQMAPAVFDAATVEVLAPRKEGDAIFKASGSVLRFAGFLAAWNFPSAGAGQARTKEEEEEEPEEGAPKDERGEKELPPLVEGEAPGLPGGGAEPAFHPAAGPLQRRQPGEGPGGARHRPALHLRPRPSAPSSTVPMWSASRAGGYKPTELGGLINTLLVKHFHGHPQRPVHRPDGGAAGQGGGGHAGLARGRGQLLHPFAVEPLAAQGAVAEK